jgi:hypothetical protein
MLLSFDILLRAEMPGCAPSPRICASVQGTVQSSDSSLAVVDSSFECITVQFIAQLSGGAIYGIDLSDATITGSQFALRHIDDAPSDSPEDPAISTGGEWGSLFGDDCAASVSLQAGILNLSELLRCGSAAGSDHCMEDGIRGIAVSFSLTNLNFTSCAVSSCGWAVGTYTNNAIFNGTFLSVSNCTAACHLRHVRCDPLDAEEESETRNTAVADLRIYPFGIDK